MDYKQTIIDALEVLRKKEQADKEVWKARAYAKAIKALKEREGPIGSLEDAKAIPGIGAKIADKIKEIIETGKLHQVNAINQNENYKIIDELMQIHGIGPAKANELVKEKGIKTIEDLMGRADELLNDKQKMGLKYYKDIQERIPRAEMIKHNDYIMGVIASIDPALKAVIAGSFRRGEKNSGDIDVLITNPVGASPGPGVIKSIVDVFMKDKYICDVLALGDKKCMAVCRLKHHQTHRRIDLMLTKPSEFAFAVLYFTGSATFNVAMRNWALARGLSLSEHGLKEVKTGEFVDCLFESEEDVFNYLDLKYVEPTARSSGYELVSV